MTGPETPRESELAEPEITYSLADTIAPIRQHDRQIGIAVILAAVITLSVNFLLPVYYKSTATLLPETEKSKLSSLEHFADVASLAGVKMPGSEVSRLYPIIVSSETILRSAIEKKFKTNRFPDSVNLIQFFELDEDTYEENMYEALKTMGKLLSATFEPKTGLVEITVEMKEPGLAADVLNVVVDELDKFMRLKRVTSASEQRKWIELRLKQVQEELREAEERLKTFREKNRRVMDSPELLLDQERLVRNVQVKSTVFVELTKQSELAKIEEIKNITLVNVLDPGRPAVRKERPKRLINTAIVSVLTLFVACMFFVVRSLYGETIRKSWELPQKA